MHDYAAWLQLLGTVFGESKETNVFVQAREIFPALTLDLNAQQINHVGGFQYVIQSTNNVDSDGFKAAGNQCARSNQRHVRSQFFERPDVRARYAAEQNIAHNRNIESGDTSHSLAYREDIKQSLGRMFMRAVTGVDNTGFQAFREKFWRSRRTVA